MSARGSSAGAPAGAGALQPISWRARGAQACVRGMDAHGDDEGQRGQQPAVRHTRCSNHFGFFMRTCCHRFSITLTCTGFARNLRRRDSRDTMLCTPDAPSRGRCMRATHISRLATTNLVARRLLYSASMWAPSQLFCARPARHPPPAERCGPLSRGRPTGSVWWWEPWIARRPLRPFCRASNPSRPARPRNLGPPRCR